MHRSFSSWTAVVAYLLDLRADNHEGTSELFAFAGVQREHCILYQVRRA